jgi:hypothetical protein
LEFQEGLVSSEAIGTGLVGFGVVFVDTWVLECHVEEVDGCGWWEDIVGETGENGAVKATREEDRYWWMVGASTVWQTQLH